MPQVQWPLFPAGVTPINDQLAVSTRDGQVVYLNGHLPVFTHATADLAAFRLFTTQLIVNGTATQGEIVRAFGVPAITVKRCVKRHRTAGAAAFFAPPAPRPGRKLTPAVVPQAQALLDQGLAVPAVAAETGVLANTLHKAIRAGRLVRRPDVKKVAPEPGPALSESGPAPSAASSTQSERRVADANAALGCGATRLEARLLASVGQLQEAPLEFVAATDVPCAGVLCAVPALLLKGLLRHSRQHFTLPPGFYPLETIFLVLAFMALARLRSVEALRYEPPGEWGKLVGLDRIPEVRTLRAKLGQLCAEPAPTAALAQDWMAATAPASAGVFYVDGHVCVYHGALTPLPRRYVTRERLCLRGTTDHWVNALDGRPFFVVTRPVDPGLVTVLRDELVPRLLADVARLAGGPVVAAVAPTPRAADPAERPAPPRFTLVFDREGYSPAFFAKLKALDVAILSYHKFPDTDWPAEEFAPHTVTLAHGEQVTMDLAERGTRLPNGLWLREVRRRGADATQVGILATDYACALGPIAVRMCARWCQENFFKYMREHFALDRLVEHGTAPLPETTRVVNPAWRRLDQAVRRETALLHRHQAAFGAHTLSPAPEPPEVESWQRREGELTATLARTAARVAELKTQRKAAPRHVELQALPAEERFARLRPTRKHFVDTIKLVAYRAETAMAHLVRETLARPDDARTLLRELYRTTADLQPDPAHKTLTVRLHPLTTRAHDTTVRALCAELTATETLFPGTNLRLVYALAGSP